MAGGVTQVAVGAVTQVAARMLVEQRPVDTAGDAAHPLSDEIVRPFRPRASTAAVAEVGAVTGVHPGGSVFLHGFYSADLRVQQRCEVSARSKKDEGGKRKKRKH